LPLPVDAVKVLTAGLSHCPEGIKQTQGFPALLGAMDAGIIAEALRQLVPMAAGAGAQKDAIEGISGIDARSAGALGRIEALQQAIHHLPQVVRNFPDGRQGLGF